MEIINLRFTYLELSWSNKLTKVFFVFLFLISSIGFSQTVSITATQATANEAGLSPGEFTISATGVGGGANSSIEVFLSIDPASLAVNGVDIATLPVSVTVNTPFGNGQEIVSLNVLQDILVEGAENVIWRIDTNAAYDVSVANPSAEVVIADNDFADMTVNSASGEEGTNLVFTVTLEDTVEYPFQVTIGYVDGTATIGADYTNSPQILSFNGNTGQAIDFTVPTVEDTLIEGPEDFTVTLTSDNTSVIDTDTGIGTITDNDTAGVNVNTTIGTTTEAGGQATFTFTLTSEPTDDVTIPINQYDGTETSGPGSIVLNAANWNTGVDLIVTGVDDNIIDGDISDLINTGNVASDDPNYQSLNANDVPQLTVTNEDNDTAGVNISTISGDTGEDGTQATFTVTLNSEPTNPVTVALSSNNTDEGTVPASVTIPVNSWDTGVVVTVTGVDDIIVDGDIDYAIITGNVTSADTDYDALSDVDVADVAVTNTDDDDVGVNISLISGNTTEAGGTASFTVTLNSQPTNNVTIALSSSDTSEGTVIASVVKTPANWNLNTVVIVTGVDDFIVDGDVNYTIITGNVTSTDNNYNALNGGSVANVAVVNTDDDQASLSILNPLSLSVNENVAGGIFEIPVQLDLEVDGGTIVPFTISNGTATGGGEDFTAANGNLTFAGTANEVELITITIVDDEDIEETETFTVQLGIPTNGVTLNGSGNATVTINDDDNCTPAPILNTGVQTIFCGEESETGQTPIFQNTTVSSLNDYTDSSPPNGSNNISLTWSTLPDPLNENAYLSAAQVANPTVEGSYFGFFLDNNGTPNNFDDDCASGFIEVELSLNIIPTVLVTPNGRCGPGTVLLSVTTNAAASLNWYAAIDSDNPLGTGPNFTTPSINTTTTYYVEAVENTCVSERVAVVATIGFEATTGTAINASACSVSANGPVILDLDNRISGQSAGVWTVNTDPSNSIVINNENVVDFTGVVDGNYIFTYTTTGSTAPCTNASVDITIAVSDCESDADEDGLFGGEEAVLGTDPNNADSDGDGMDDGDEVGPDVNSPLDEDNDGIIDALDSNTLDTDNDGVVDQEDPANTNPCVPFRTNGFCDFDGDGITDEDELVNGTDPDNPCDPDENSPTCTPIDLAITKEVDNPNAVVGDTVTFTITLNNPEDRTAINIIVGDLLETGFDFVSANTSVGDYSEVTGEWNNFTIGPNSSETLVITATVAEGSVYSNTAELLFSLPVDENENNNVATVQLNVDVPEGIDLNIVKTVNNRAPLVGEQITFTISAENRSPGGEIISNISIRDSISTTLNPNTRFLYDSHISSVGNYDPIAGVWIIEFLETGEQNIATLDITVTVPREGIYANTATLLESSPADSNPSNNESFLDVTVSEPTPTDPGFLFNQFSPNGDGVNDVLRINLRDSETELDLGIVYRIKVYDRYGNLVFEGENTVPNNSQRITDVWDGTYKGENVAKGTYYYIMNYDIGSGPTIDKGWIQLIR